MRPEPTVAQGLMQVAAGFGALLLTCSIAVSDGGQLFGRWVFAQTQDPMTDEAYFAVGTKSDGDIEHSLVFACDAQSKIVQFVVRGVEFADIQASAETKLRWRIDNQAMKYGVFSYDGEFVNWSAATARPELVFALARAVIEAKTRFVIQGRNNPVTFPVNGAHAAISRLYDACGCESADAVGLCMGLPH